MGVLDPGGLQSWQAIAAISWPDVAFSFLAILLEGTPFLILGALISGVIDAWVPPGAIARLLPRQGWLAVLVAGLLGIVLPLCECAAIPVIRRMLRKGLPLSCAITYMLAAPVVSPIVWFSTYKAFGFLEPVGPPLDLAQRPPLPEEFATWRLLLGLGTAVLLGWTALKLKPHWILRPKLLASSILGSGAVSGANNLGEARDAGEVPRPSELPLAAPDRVAYALRAALRDFLEVAVYFVIGVALTAILQNQLSYATVRDLGERPLVAMLAMQGLAFTLGLCSTSDAFIAANLSASLNVPLMASMAFLVFGPMFDLKLVALYLTVFRRRFVLGLGLVLFVLVGVLCVYWWHVVGPPPV